MTAICRRLPRLLHELLLARADGTYAKLLARLAKTDVLVLDDWGIAPLVDQERRDLLEVFEDRHGSRSTLLATQLPIDAWHAHIGDPTVADAILDRLVDNAHRVELTGGSMRKKRSNLISEDKPAKKQPERRRFAPSTDRLAQSQRSPSARIPDRLSRNPQVFLIRILFRRRAVLLCALIPVCFAGPPSRSTWSGESAWVFSSELELGPLRAHRPVSVRCSADATSHEVDGLFEIGSKLCNGSLSPRSLRQGIEAGSAVLADVSGTSV